MIGSAPAFSDITAITLNMNPRNAEPTSPRKIRAGGQFQARKPALDPAISAQTRPSSGRAAAPSTSTAASDTATASPPASPSIPSMKL